jgi:hypothetical protein
MFRVRAQPLSRRFPRRRLFFDASQFVFAGSGARLADCGANRARELVAWLPMLVSTENHFQPGVIPAASRQWFLGVSVAVGKHPIVVDTMGMDATLNKLTELTTKEGGVWAPPIGVSISAVLRQLRANERETGVKLPGARLTIARDHPDFDRFLAEAVAYRQAADARLRAKARTSKNARAALRETAPPLVETVGYDEAALAVAAKGKE